ncbi:hypothetical protein SCHPADRAFT_1000780 [Schizopora paradoxa]|uniref:Uncharacterized protein n=1 Tax=Schizopora paradoxa TaxID=27342 RepID=A0A0H2RA00_9AGAM|nr:hypothetical protein SCHPADRAFT_1000780 [Schizopora paradoxa]
MDVTVVDIGNRNSSPEPPPKSSSESALRVHDEWINDDISFPTKSDALIASLALKKQSDPILIDAFLSLLKDPNFNPAECTLHSVADIHSLASSYRKETDNYTPKQFSPMQIPIFVWEEVMVHIGDQWVAYALKLCDDAAQYSTIWDNNIFAAPYSYQLSDLCNASIVHPSWTRPAQRQMGRVLVLHETNERTLDAAIKCGLYGNWTEILALKGSIAYSGWGAPQQGFTDTLSPNVSLLKSFITRLPSLNTLHFEASFLSHPLVLLNALQFLSSVTTVSIVHQNVTINKSIGEIFEHLERWPGLRNLSLTGFECNLKSPDPLDRLLASRNLPELSSIFISGGDGHLHRDTLIHWVRWKKTSLPHETIKFTACDIRFRRLYTTPQNLPAANYDHGHVNYFAVLDGEPSLSWLPTIDRISLMNIYESEAEQLLEMAAAVRHLSWAGTSFSPTIALPTNVSDLKLSVSLASDDLWHSHDRNLHAFLLDKGNSSLRLITITISSFGHPQDLHTDIDIPRIYFPRSSYLCKTLNLSLIIDVLFS